MVRDLLARTRTRLRGALVATAGGRWLAALLAALAAAFVVDWLAIARITEDGPGDLPARALLLALLAGLVLWRLWRGPLAELRRRWDDDAVARAVERHHPGLGGRLLSGVQLARELDRADALASPDLARAAIARHGPLLRPAPDGALLQALAAGVAGVQAGGLTAWKASALAYAVAMALGELAGGDPATRPEPLQRAAAWALARLDATLAVDDLAARAGLSPAHFARAFAAAYGLPPMAWINGQRLDRAARLLTGGDLPVAEVGRRCGFAEPSYFCRVFRRAYALTPAGYRATVR
ncbi:MAG: helix-turn-helix transcriptional regulator [Planctomycetes bacterium]|nr:helix-turn-helix transcriptional regulator [Planctomycetota bacterium]